MPIYARYSHEGDELLQHTPGSDVAAGEPVEISTNFFGVSPLFVEAGTPGEFRVTGVFKGLKVTKADTFAVGDMVDWVPASGFESGSCWRVVEDSLATSNFVQIEINPGGGGNFGAGIGYEEVLNKAARPDPATKADGYLVFVQSNQVVYRSYNDAWIIARAGTSGDDVGQAFILSQGEAEIDQIYHNTESGGTHFWNGAAWATVAT